MVRRHEVRDGPIKVVAGTLGIFFYIVREEKPGTLWAWGQTSCVLSFLTVTSLCS